MPAITASKPSTQIQIDKLRPIRFNWQSGCRFEEAYGRSIARSLNDEAGMRFVTYLAWAGMLHAEPTLQLRDVEKRIQAFINADGDISELAVQLVGALVDSGILGKVRKPKTESSDESDTPTETGEGSEGNVEAAPEQ